MGEARDCCLGLRSLPARPGAPDLLALEWTSSGEVHNPFRWMGVILVAGFILSLLSPKRKWFDGDED